MSREIKFRVFEDGTGKLIADQVPISKISFYDYEGDALLENEGLIVVQYTGLKDKNGVEIYEGDILKGKAYEFNSPKRIIGVVEYSYCEFKVVGTGKTKGIKAELNTVYEVIGNKYKHPHLLKV